MCAQAPPSSPKEKRCSERSTRSSSERSPSPTRSEKFTGGKTQLAKGLDLFRWSFVCPFSGPVDHASAEFAAHVSIESCAIIAALGKICRCFIFQLESSQTSAGSKWQGYFELHAKHSLEWVLQHTKELPPVKFLQPAQGSASSNWKFACDPSVRLCGPWLKGTPSPDAPIKKVCVFFLEFHFIVTFCRKRYPTVRCFLFLILMLLLGSLILPMWVDFILGILTTINRTIIQYDIFPQGTGGTPIE